MEGTKPQHPTDVVVATVVQLPPEMWVTIFDSLSMTDILSFALLSKQWREFAFAHPRFNSYFSSPQQKNKSANALTQTLDTLLNRAPQISTLDLSRTRLDKSHLQTVCSFNLTTLSLNACTRLSRESFTECILPSSITKLELAYAKITDPILEIIFNHLTNLHTLSLAHCMGISGPGLEYVPASLTNLDLSNTWNLRGKQLVHLSRAPALASLNLVNAKCVNSEDITRLPGTLTSLDLSDLTKTTDDGLQDLSPNLLTLKLRRCSSVTSKSYQYLPKNLLRLECGYCKIETLDGMPQNLHVLDLSYCYRLHDDSLVNFGLLTNLHDLNMTGCENITDAGFAYIPTSVVTLNLTECYQLTDEGLLHLPKGLKSVDLSFCWHVTDKGLKYNLPERLEELAVLPYLQPSNSNHSSKPFDINSIYNTTTLFDEGKDNTSDVTACISMETLDYLSKERNITVVFKRARSNHNNNSSGSGGGGCGRNRGSGSNNTQQRVDSQENTWVTG